MTRTVRNRLFLALALGVATAAPRSLLGRSLPDGDVVSLAFSPCFNQFAALALPASTTPSFLRETTSESRFETPFNASTFDRFFLGDAVPTFAPPSYDELFAPPTCPNGACSLAPLSPQTPQNSALPTAPNGVLRSVVRVYNAYEETVSTADAALGPTRRRVVEKGSGAFVADSLGTRYVLTAAHIFRDGRGKITAQSVDGRVFAASLVLASEDCDVALLRVDASEDAPALTISASWPRQGETVWRAGFGPNETLQELAGVVKGYVKTDRYSTYETLKIDGPARQGDSGGPVYNASGEIVGVVWGTDGSDAYATYCGRVLKTLCDFSPSFAPSDVQVDTPSQTPSEEQPFDAVVDAASNADADSPETTETAPLNRDAPTLAPTSKFRDFWNAALAFTVVFAFGYCGFFASKSR